MKVIFIAYFCSCNIVGAQVLLDIEHLIELLEKDKFSPNYIYEGVMGLVRKFTQNRNTFLEEKEEYGKRSFELFVIKEHGKLYLFQNANNSAERLLFHKNSLGLWGIQPGLDKYDRSLSTNKYYN